MKERGVYARALDSGASRRKRLARGLSLVASFSFAPVTIPACGGASSSRSIGSSGESGVGGGALPGGRGGSGGAGRSGTAGAVATGGVDGSVYRTPEDCKTPQVSSETGDCLLVEECLKTADIGGGVAIQHPSIRNVSCNAQDGGWHCECVDDNAGFALDFDTPEFDACTALQNACDRDARIEPSGATTCAPKSLEAAPCRAAPRSLASAP